MEDIDYVVPANFQEQTLDWAAALGDEKPSPKLEFLKRYLRTMTIEELHRAGKILTLRKRRVVKDNKGKEDDNIQNKKPHLMSEAAHSSKDAVSPSEPVCEPWWNKYSKEDVVAFDTEQVTRFNQRKMENENVVATIDIVNGNLEVIYSAKVYHPKNSFKLSPHAKFLTGFNNDTFDDPAYPNEEDVKQKVKEILQGKLVITCGGSNDYEALDACMRDYDHFDLQHHYYLDCINEKGAILRQPHSLRSLSSFYLNRNPQSGLHSSLADATATMELFEIYKKVKIEDEPQNLDCRYNSNYPYNDIPVIPSPLATFMKKKKKSKAIHYG